MRAYRDVKVAEDNRKKLSELSALLAERNIELEKVNTTLEERVDARTHRFEQELAERQRAEKALQEANQELAKWTEELEKKTVELARAKEIRLN
ncbi:MAG: hypothetical protein B6242_04780 [Anaerolineaceae bacterium 4572_78]|nr:MAG: hypothetical protein B6242_04780 [Anaerolineaceae bacterium 4572_78]